MGIRVSFLLALSSILCFNSQPKSNHNGNSTSYPAHRTHKFPVIVDCFFLCGEGGSDCCVKLWSSQNACNKDEDDDLMLG